VQPCLGFGESRVVACLGRDAVMQFGKAQRRRIPGVSVEIGVPAPAANGRHVASAIDGVKPREFPFQRRGGRKGALPRHGKGTIHTTGIEKRKAGGTVQNAIGRLDAFPPATGLRILGLNHQRLDPPGCRQHQAAGITKPDDPPVQRIPRNQQREGRAPRRCFLPRTDAGAARDPKNMREVTRDQGLGAGKRKIGQICQDRHQGRGAQCRAVILRSAPIFGVGRSVRRHAWLALPRIAMQRRQFRIRTQETAMAGQG